MGVRGKFGSSLCLLAEKAGMSLALTKYLDSAVGRHLLNNNKITPLNFLTVQLRKM